MGGRLELPLKPTEWTTETTAGDVRGKDQTMLFSMQVQNGGGDVRVMAKALFNLSQRLDMELTTQVGKDYTLMPVFLRASPKWSEEQLEDELKRVEAALK